jgi:hypothetical protein
MQSPVSTRLHLPPDGRLVFEQTQDSDEIVRAVHAARDMVRRDTGPAGSRFLGSVPILLAQLWARECGAAVGTREWAQYARNKLLSDEFRDLRVHGG